MRRKHHTKTPHAMLLSNSENVSSSQRNSSHEKLLLAVFLPDEGSLSYNDSDSGIWDCGAYEKKP